MPQQIEETIAMVEKAIANSLAREQEIINQINDHGEANDGHEGLDVASLESSRRKLLGDRRKLQQGLGQLRGQHRRMMQKTDEAQQANIEEAVRIAGGVA